MRDRRQRVTNLVRAPAFVGYLQGGRFADEVLPEVSRLRMEAELSTVSLIALKPTQQPEKRDSAKP